MKTATSLTLIAAGAITAFAITAHVSFLNLQVTGWIFILTGVAGAIITRSSWLRRIRVAKGRPGAAATEGSGQRPPPSRRAVPGRQAAVAFDATSAEPETIEEYVGRLTRARTCGAGHRRTRGLMTRPSTTPRPSACRPLPTSTAAAPLTAMTRSRPLLALSG